MRRSEVVGVLQAAAKRAAGSDGYASAGGLRVDFAPVTAGITAGLAYTSALLARGGRVVADPEDALGRMVESALVVMRSRAELEGAGSDGR